MSVIRYAIGTDIISTQTVLFIKREPLFARVRLLCLNLQSESSAGESAIRPTTAAPLRDMNFIFYDNTARRWMMFG
jgi:hypothetical protein